MREAGPAVLRLALAAVFIAHGAQKLFGAWGGGGLLGTAAFFEAAGLAPAYLLAVMAAVLEGAGGLLLVAGVLTRWVALALAAEMAVALWMVHLPHGFFLNWTMAPGVGHGYEFNLVLIAALVCLALTGPGTLSFDLYRARRAETEARGRARLRETQ